MKHLKRIYYDTMNSWNNQQSIAYNLKVYNVIDRKLQHKVYELMECDDFYDDINILIDDFDIENNYKWQARFNGRSGGYLVLYSGGKHENGRVYTEMRGHNLDDIPVNIRKSFRRLALDIIKTVEYQAKNYKPIEKIVNIPEKIKVMG